MSTELREALDEAWVDDEVVEETTSESSGEEISAAVEPEPEVTGEAAPEAAPEAIGGDEGVGSPEPIGTPEQSAAPIGWDPETWGGVPEAAREHVAKREAEVEKVLRNSADARKSHQALGQLAQTYGAVMATEGVQDPVLALDGLLQTVSQLRMGSSTQKAKKMADLVQHFGIDIAELDNALAGEAPSPEVQQYDQMQQMIDQRMAPVNQVMQNLAGMQQQKMAQSNQQVAEEVNQFSTQAEFIEVVRNDMADLLDMATNRGQQMTLQEAYDKACAVNPQVQQTLQQRMAQKKTAASSVAGHGASTNKGETLSLHDELVAAWENFS